MAASSSSMCTVLPMKYYWANLQTYYFFVIMCHYNFLNKTVCQSNFLEITDEREVIYQSTQREQ